MSSGERKTTGRPLDVRILGLNGGPFLNSLSRGQNTQTSGVSVLSTTLPEPHREVSKELRTVPIPSTGDIETMTDPQYRTVPFLARQERANRQVETQTAKKIVNSPWSMGLLPAGFDIFIGVCCWRLEDSNVRVPYSSVITYGRSSNGFFNGKAGDVLAFCIHRPWHWRLKGKSQGPSKARSDGVILPAVASVCDQHRKANKVATTYLGTWVGRDEPVKVLFAHLSKAFMPSSHIPGVHRSPNKPTNQLHVLLVRDRAAVSGGRPQVLYSVKP